MSVNVKSLSEMIEKDVFTHKGVYSGRVSDLVLDLDKFRIKSIAIDAVKGSFLSKFVGSKKGVIVPFRLIQSIGDVVIIKHISPMETEEEPSEDLEDEE